MKSLEQLAEALTEIAQLPEAVQKARQEQFDNIQTLEKTIEAQGRKLALIEKRQGENHSAAMEMVKNLIIQEFKEHAKSAITRYGFVIDADRPDESLENAIKNGQELQQPFWEEGEERWQRELGESPKGEGWYGSVSMPVITLVLTEPEYKFRNTIRLPGRFQLRSYSRWGSAIRCDGTGDKVLVDHIPYGHCYNEPIGIYVEPATTLPSGMIVRPFEQSINDCLIVGSNGVLPIYLAQNPDRLHITGNNIQQHGGGFFGIKHGPAYEADWMPKPARPDDLTYIGDTVISVNQFEGPHRMTHPSGSRKQAGVFFTGLNVQVRDNNFWGWSQCVYSHGGGGRVITGNTANHGDTADGRAWANKDELVMATVCQDNKNPDAVGLNAGGFLEIKPRKKERVALTAGWHNEGEYYL